MWTGRGDKQPRCPRLIRALARRGDARERRRGAGHGGKGDYKAAWRVTYKI